MRTTTEWRDAFRGYELIANIWPPDQRRLLRDALFAQEPVTRFMNKLIPRAAALFRGEAGAQIDALRPKFRRAGERFGWPEPGVLDDVYHAAIYLVWSNWTSMHWFRGQRRDDWPMKPSIYRRAPTAVEFEAALSRVASFSEHLARAYPVALDEAQCVAVAQHYGVETWLLDATRSPWIALYFASKEGEEGDVGIVRQINPHDWRDLAAGVEVEVRGVRRIERQEAVFLEAPHPEFFDQIGSLELRFRQRSGLTFESTLLGVGDDLLHDADPIVPVVEAWRHTAAPPRRCLRTPPTRRSISPLGTDDYFELVLRRHCVGRRLDPDDERALRLACRLHAELQARKHEVPAWKRSLSRLTGAVCFMLVTPSLERKLHWILEDYEDAFPPGYVAGLVQIRGKAADISNLG